MSGIAVMQAILVIAAVAATLCFVLATAYDIWYGFFVSRRTIRVADSEADSPRLTVIAHRVDSVAIANACIRSFGEGKYQQTDIVLVMGQQVPRNAIVQIRRSIAKSSRKVIVYAPRATLKLGEVLKRAYHKSKRGNHVLCVDARHAVATNWSNIANVQNTCKSTHIRTVVFAEGISVPTSFTELSTTLLQLSRTVLIKALASTRLLRVSYENTALYTREAFIKAVEASRAQPAMYDSRVILHDGRHRYADSTTMASAVAMAVIVIYVLCGGVLAATFVDSQQLLSGWIVAAIWFAAAIWSDDTLTLRRRLMLSATLPVSYIVVIATAIVLGLQKTVARNK